MRGMLEPEAREKEDERPDVGPTPNSARLAVSPALLVGLAVALLWSFFLATGLVGLDFGEHWDEDRLMMSTWRVVGSGSLRPGFYVYPTLTHWLTWLPTLPTLLAGFPAAKQCLATVDPTLPTDWTPCFEQWTTHAVQALSLERVTLRSRFLFLLVSSAAVALTGIAVWRHRRRAGEAVLAAGVVALSWEVSYHARWTAPDTLLMSVAALLAWVLHEAEQRGSDRWMSGAAVVAAVGASTKLTGAILLIPVLLVGAAEPRKERFFPRFLGWRAARLGAVFAIAFGLLSPGVLVDFPQFVMEVLHESRHYATGHGVHTVAPGPMHLAKMLVYLLGPLLSPRWPMGFVLGALALAGAWAAWRDGSRTTRALTITAGVYLLYLSAQRVMLVRNLLWLTPLLAAWIARGVTFAAERIPPRLPRSIGVAPAAIAAFILAIDAASVADAARRIPERRLDGHAARTVATLLSYPNARFYLTSTARARFAEAGAPIPPNVVPRGNEADYVIGLLSELPTGGVPANEPNTFALGLTAPEVNLDYYPTWLARDRFVALRAETWRAAIAARPKPKSP
jgi:hypothetical protein